MDYNEPIVVSNYNNCVKVEPDEVVLYGCHFCQDLAFEDYEELKKHLEDHLEKEDKDDGIQVKKVGVTTNIQTSKAFFNIFTR